MTGHSSSIPRHSNSIPQEDEIDLIALFSVLWRGRWIVVSFVLTATLAATVFALYLHDVYRVEAIIAPPSPYQLEQLQPSTLMGATNYQLDKVEPSKLYALSLSYFASTAQREGFWQRKYNVSLPHVGEKANEELQRFKSFANSIYINKLDAKSGSDQISLGIESSTPTEGRVLITEFIQYVDNYALQRQIEEMHIGYNAVIDRVSGDLEALKLRKAQALRDQLAILTEAHTMAKSLNIVDTPYDKVENVGLTVLDNRLYLLGTKVLTEEIKALQARQGKPLASFDQEIRTMEQWKEQLTQDKQKLKLVGREVRTFKVVSAPEVSLQPISPNRPLIVLASIFLAGFLGVIVVFVRHAFRTAQAEG